MPSEFARINLSITIADLDQAWQDRLDEANSLDAAGHFGAAIAARLYALEIYLKFRICRHLGLANPLKKLEIHDLDALIIYAGLSQEMAAIPASSNLKQNWEKIVDFSGNLNDLRYLPAIRWTRQQSDDFFRWFVDPTDGVLTWLKTQT
jgi:hypothetical protein